MSPITVRTWTMKIKVETIIFSLYIFYHNLILGVSVPVIRKKLQVPNAIIADAASDIDDGDQAGRSVLFLVFFCIGIFILQM